MKKKNNQGDTFEGENYPKDVIEDEDYAICKALAKRCDRKFIEELKALYGLEDLDL